MATVKPPYKNMYGLALRRKETKAQKDIVDFTYSVMGRLMKDWTKRKPSILDLRWPL